MLTSGASNQLGAALGAGAFPYIGPIGVVAVRQLVAASVLLPIARPAVRRLTWPQWWPVLVLAAVLSTMNLALYTALDRIGLALAVTIEFLGPLAVALLGSRSARHLLVAAAAVTGVVLVLQPSASSDWAGILLALLAAACWATYILINRVAGTRLPGVTAPALATTAAAVGYLPVLIVLGRRGDLLGPWLLLAVASGLLSSVVPYAADLTALRHVPARLFGIFMSGHPVWAAAAGMLLLDETLQPAQWLGLLLVVAANIVTTLDSRPRT